jgi:hypothetical protein
MDTCRLIPARYPATGILDSVASPQDLNAVLELAGWTDDRVRMELGILHTIPRTEWVTGWPLASVVMAAYCHPRPGGGRFNGPDRGAWYAGLDLDTAHAEALYHRGRELAEIGIYETRVQVRLLRADFNAAFHDVREGFAQYHDPDSYHASQALARELLYDRSNGIVYRSVRRHGGECIACFRPIFVGNPRIAGHYEYEWQGGPKARIRTLRESVTKAAV